MLIIDLLHNVNRQLMLSLHKVKSTDFITNPNTLLIFRKIELEFKPSDDCTMWHFLSHKLAFPLFPNTVTFQPVNGIK